MRIETEEWMPLSEATAATGFAASVVYRTVDRLGIGAVFFGVKCIRRSDLQKVIDAKMPAGNPRWIASGDEAGEAARKATESRIARVAAKGFTAAEKRRNTRLSSSPSES